jgi:serine/threonine protein phosphatase PrpC
MFDDDPNMSFVGIYDGHGGRDIVDFLATELEKNIAQELKVEDGASIPEKLARAYLLTDVQSCQAELMGSGATAVTCLLKKSTTKGEGGREEVVREIYAANVGDSRAVLCRGGKGMRLTYDHKADDGAEQARIEAAGGFVLRNRVLGILAVTRSFGDHRMKDYVVGLPYTSTTTVEEGGGGGGEGGGGEGGGGDPFLILACDGVWDVLSDDEAVGLVQALWEREGGRMDVDAAGLLVQESMRRGSSDNITCVVVFL